MALSAPLPASPSLSPHLQVCLKRLRQHLFPSLKIEELEHAFAGGACRRCMPRRMHLQQLRVRQQVGGHYGATAEAECEIVRTCEGKKVSC